jgi:acyl-CoA synthetase (AMP-forming)/AMP-acid ligase II
VFIDVLPRNPAGKVLKFDLRETHGQPIVETEAPAPHEGATTTAG